MSGELKPYEQIGVAMTCRSFEEYVRMFALETDLLRKSGPILDVAAGASSFVAEACGRGYQAVAADPMYALEPEAIYEHGSKEIAISTAKLGAIKEQCDWSYYGSIDRHRANREASLERFIAHYRVSQDSGVYAQAMLPSLPYPDESFSLVLVSHFLFLYEGQFDLTFHRNALRELLRVCRKDGEIRIYPIFTLKWERYPYLAELLDELGEEGVRSRIVESKLPFIPGSKEVLRLTYGSA
ncbi:methyltransferase domain-containing protein [Paenibacillus puerhi]|uniref:methyltransferase domain-containing protein n=1 Tax=Paenibacillus puerhi TaxID=2692622 RepID=UPI001358A72C|nr:methyltransferase domain-containing protein [Paenibacillus puerhi]